MVVDMTALTFMDCAGYRELVITLLVLERRGVSLSLLAPAGELLRLLTLLERGARGPTFVSRSAPLGEAPCAPVLS